MREALARTDTDHIAFHGCIDWHSAVHGTWALTAYSRMTGDTRYAPFIAEVLSPEKIAAERAFIAARPDFEMPYGRAWFLRLALEHERAFGSDALKPMADDVLASLLAIYAQRQPDPRRGSYQSDSWALINMYDYAQKSQNGAALRDRSGLGTAAFRAVRGDLRLRPRSRPLHGRRDELGLAGEPGLGAGCVRPLGADVLRSVRVYRSRSRSRSTGTITG